MKDAITPEDELPIVPPEDDPAGGAGGNHEVTESEPADETIPEDELDEEEDDEAAAADALYEKYDGDPKKIASAIDEATAAREAEAARNEAVQKALAEHGWTIGDDGALTPPPAQQPQEPAVRWEPLPDGNYRHPDGNVYDKFGVMVVTDEEWAAYAQTVDAETYAKDYAAYVVEKANAEKEYNDTVNARAAEVHTEAKKAFQQIVDAAPEIKSYPGLQAMVDDAEKLFLSLPPQDRLHPAAFDLALVMQLAPKLPEFLEHLRSATNQRVTAKVGAERKTIATTGGVSPAGGGVEPEPTTSALTADEEAARVKYNRQTKSDISPQEWLQYAR